MHVQVVAVIGAAPDDTAHCMVLPASAILINSSAGTMVVKPHSSDTVRLSPDGHHVEEHHVWPFGGPRATADECFQSDSPELLRLHCVAPLPSALPHPKAPLMPHLQPGFTAVQALRRVAVSAPILGPIVPNVRCCIFGFA